MDSAPARSSGGHGFDSCRGFRFFLSHTRAWHVVQFSFHHRIRIHHFLNGETMKAEHRTLHFQSMSLPQNVHKCTFTGSGSQGQLVYWFCLTELWNSIKCRVLCFLFFSFQKTKRTIWRSYYTEWLLQLLLMTTKLTWFLGSAETNLRDHRFFYQLVEVDFRGNSVVHSQHWLLCSVTSL